MYVLIAQLCLFATPWTVAHQAPLSMEFARQEYLRGLPFPSPGLRYMCQIVSYTLWGETWSLVTVSVVEVLFKLLLFLLDYFFLHFLTSLIASQVCSLEFRRSRRLIGLLR